MAASFRLLAGLAQWEIGDAVNFDQHARKLAKIAPHSSTDGVRLRKAARINGVVAREQAAVAEVHRDLHHIVKGSAISGENGFDIVDDALGLGLNGVARELAGFGIDGTSSSYEDEVACPP